MRKIGRYIIKGRLGRGGMSTVYKAQAPVTGRTVALKLLQPRESLLTDLVGAERLRRIFVEEALIMGEISHANIAKIIDCDESGDAPFIVLEYFAHSVGSLIGEGYQVEKPSRVISINKTFQYIDQALRGLERLHFAGIIHRDIKPFNLMITDDDRIKIIDFGLSRVRGEETMAIPGMQVGSPYYASPEQETNPQKADERADLFSVGIMAYRMLTGKLVSVRQKRIPAPSTMNSDLGPEWDAYLLKSIEPHPDDRYPSAREMRLNLEETYHLWVRKSKTICRFVAQDQAGPVIPQTRLRSTHGFIRQRQLLRQFDLDALMRPRVYTPHRFEFKDRGLLYCTDTGILWQREGAGFTLSWQKANEYIDYLNESNLHGRNTWRLPTVEELHTLLRPPTLLRDFCYQSYFASHVHWLWSADTCSRQTAWTVDFVESYFQPLDKDGTASVCAVSSTNPDCL